jgi:type I restriction enzyme S subunit
MKWETVEIGQLGEVVTGNTPPRKNPELYGDFIPFIKPTDMEIDRRYTPNPEECYSELGYEKYKKSLIPKGATCVVTIGSIGKKMTQALCDCFINQAVNAVIPNNEYDNDFVFYLLKNNLHKVKGLDSGTSSGRENVSKSAFSSIEVKVTKHLPTQRKIASILSAYDDLIENNLKRVKLLEGAININYKNFISIEDKNFINVKLNSFVNIISGFPFKSNYYNENGKHKIVTIKNVQDGFFVPVVTDRIDDVPDNMNNGLFLSTGDVIMSLTGNVGRVCLVYGDDYVLNQRVVKLSAKELIDQSFIYALVRDKQMLTILENLSNGTAQQNLSPIKMGELPIRYPSSNLREDFDKKVSPMIEMICKLNMQNTKLREARDILLPKLMNGQIEV